MDNNDTKLRILLERMPLQQPSPVFRASLMVKVHAEAKRKARRENILEWVGLVSSVLLLLAVGIMALVRIGVQEMMLRPIEIAVTPATLFYVKSSCFLCAIIAVLLCADYWLRKRYQSKLK